MTAVMDVIPPPGAATLREAAPLRALVPVQRRPAPAPLVPLPAPLVPLEAQRAAAVEAAATPAPGRRPARLLLAAVVLLLVPLLTGSTAAAVPADGAVRAYFFGDSIMSGTGASPIRPVMARVAADRLGWDVEVDGWGGTGYTTTGRSPGYLDRLRRPGALSGRYDVVLLEGGTNDARVGSTPGQIEAAVREVVAEVRRRQPQAQVVLMGAYDPPGSVDLRRSVADAVVRQVAVDLGLAFFSPLSGGWHTGQDPDRFLHADRLHPDEDGYAVMGERLAEELRAAVGRDRRR
jgi:acyl-CoA thioesterase I